MVRCRLKQFPAIFLLAVTEDVRSETPIEEDNWAAAAEWAYSLGADVISSSLGYLEFDLPNTSYTDRDMDGQTAITTRVAGMAAERGVVVVNSASNGGFRADRNTLGAPADGVRVLAIGAVAADGTRVSFSSVGPTADGRIKPDLSALGVRVKVASAMGPRPTRSQAEPRSRVRWSRVWWRCSSRRTRLTPWTMSSSPCAQQQARRRVQTICLGGEL